LAQALEMSETRKLALLVADVVGYSRLAGTDEGSQMVRLLAAGVTFLVPFAAFADLFTNLGEGTTSRGEWADRRRAEPQRVLPETAWVLGYLTAASRFRPEGAPNPLRGLHASGMEHWIDNYCAANPLDDVQTVADALADELKRRSAGSKD
jgi:class 3 adenylate cyclase